MNWNQLKLAIIYHEVALTRSHISSTASVIIILHFYTLKRIKAFIPYVSSLSSLVLLHFQFNEYSIGFSESELLAERFRYKEKHVNWDEMKRPNVLITAVAESATRFS